MRKNLGRKQARENARATEKKAGALNRKATHKMRTHDGMKYKSGGLT